MSDTTPAYATALQRHFADLRDGNHGGAESRAEKEELFAKAVVLLGPFARQVLDEVNESLLLGTGEVVASGLREGGDGTEAVWELSWPEQRAAGLEPIRLHAFFGAQFHHPHLRGTTVGVWPLNVFTERQAADEVPTMRAIAAADLHNMVFERDYRIVPATAQRDE